MRVLCSIRTLLLLLLVGLSFVTLTSGGLIFPTSTLPNLPIPLSQSTAVYYNGSIYVIGGLTSGALFVSSVYVFQNGKWIDGPPLPFHLAEAGGVVLNNNIYVVGGLNESGIFGGILVFNGNSWYTISTSMPVPVYGAVVFAYNNQIYVIGGMNTTGFTLSPPSRLIQVYSLNTNSWRIIGYAPEPMGYSGYYFNGNALYVVGGYIGYASGSNQVYMYFPSNNTWVSLPPLKTNVYANAVGYYGGILYGVGGYYYNSLGQFIPGAIYYMNTSWKLSDFNENIPTVYSAYVQVGNKLYIIGGLDASKGFVATSAFQEVSLILPPPKPVIRFAQAGNNSISLSWYDTNTSGYYIQWWSSIDNNKSTINVGNVSSYLFINLTNGVTYYFRIIPYNQAGNGTSSDIISLTPGAVPDSPSVKVIVGDRNATVIWSKPYNGGFPILGYYLTVKTDNSSYTINVGNVSKYTLTNLTPEVLYEVMVVAYNKLGNSSPGIVNFVALTTASISVSVYKKVNGVLISWNKTENTTYNLLISDKKGKIIVNITTTNTSYFAYIPYGIYNVTIRATNQVGTNSTSFPIVFYIPPFIPLVKFSIGNNSILNLKWNNVTGATFYLVYVNTTLIANVTTDSYSLNLTPGFHVIRVVAANPIYNSSPASLGILIQQHSVTSSITTINTIIDTVTTVMSGINIKTAVIIIAVVIVVLTIIAFLLRRGGGYGAAGI